MPLSCGAREDSRKSLGQQGDQTSQIYRSSKLNILWKDWSWSSSTLATNAKSWLTEKDPDAFAIEEKIESRRRGQQRVRWLDSITDSMDMNLSKFWKIVEDRGACMLQSIGSQRVGHDLATQQQQQHIAKHEEYRPYFTITLVEHNL